MDDREEVMTVEEAAAFLRVDDVTVQRELRKGRLPGNQVGRAWRISRKALDEYLAPGDPTRAMFQASVRLERDDVDGALKVLLRNVLGASDLPADLRIALLKRLTILAEAGERRDPAHAEGARFAPGEPYWTETRFGKISRTETPLNGVWNKHVVEPFVECLERVIDGTADPQESPEEP
jgi:excisionase family DNA binding protein